MTNYVPLICYYDGELQQNGREPVYVGGNIRADRVSKDISFKDLAIKMRKIFQSLPEETSGIDIKCRYLLDQHTSIAMRVEDDRSLSIIMDLHPHHCNAIVVYIENRSAHVSSCTTQRHIGSSSSDAGDSNGMANAPVQANVKQIKSNGLDNVHSLVIDEYPAPSKESSSPPRCDKIVLEKELEISSGSTFLLGDEPLGQYVEHLSEDSSVNVLHETKIQVLKSSEENTSSAVPWHIGSSSSDAGDSNGMANTPVQANVKQIKSNGLDNVHSLVIDEYSTPSKESSSPPRCDKVVLEKELEISSESAFLLGNEPLGQYVEHLSEDSSVNVLHDTKIQVLKSSEENTSSAVPWSQGRGSKICSKRTPFSRNDTLLFKNSTTKPKSWFRIRVLDPKDLFLRRWNRVFVITSVLALALDAMFFYAPGIDYKKNCLNWDKTLEITTCLLRSLTDLIYIVHIIFQFRTGYFVPSSRVFGRGEFVEDLGVIAKRYLSSFFLIDILAILPLPQVLILITMPHMNGSIDVRKREALRDVVLLQYLPRFLRIYPLYKVLLRVNPMTTAWAGVFLNFSLYILGSHVFGAIWYFLSIGRVDMCLRESCRSTSTCELYSLYCGNHNSGGGVLLQTSCPIIEPNTTLFDFGIYLDALQSGIPNLSFPEKLTYCFCSFGQNLKTSAYIWEVCFAVSISVFGLFFFMLLIGNVQTYLQSDTVKSEKEFRKKIQDTEQWMARKFLPENLRQRIRQYELHIWQTTRGFDDEILLRKLPKDLKRDIKRHLGLALLMQVPMFEKMNDQFLDALCDRLKPVLYTEDNLIIQEGHPVEEMLFIMSGELLSVSTHGGNTSVFDSDYLKAGDFIGEELLFWALLPTSSSNPISTRTVHASKEVEAFALIGEDLRLVISQFRLQRQQLRHILRFYSEQWRTWAACYIQLAWRRYRKRKLEKCRLDEEARLQDQIIKNVASSTSLGAAIYASRFAANTLRNIRRSTARKAMLHHVLGRMQKPAEPELLC